MCPTILNSGWLNGCLLLWNLRTRSRLFPMYNSCTTHHGFRLCLPSPPSQLLTIHTPTSLDNLEALEHLRSDLVLFLTHAVLPLLHPFPNLTQPSKSDSKHHLPSEVQSPRALWLSGPAFSTAPNTPSVSVSASQAEVNFLQGWGDGSLLCIPSPHSACYEQVLSGWSFALRFRLF